MKSLNRLTQLTVMVICPGYPFSTIFFKENNLTWLERLAISCGLTFVILSTTVYSITSRNILPFNSWGVIIISLCLTILSYLTTILISKITHTKRIPHWPSLKLFLNKEKEIIILLSILFTIFFIELAIFIGRYPYLFAADPYFFKHVSDLTIATQHFPTVIINFIPIIHNTYEPLFTVFATIISLITKINTFIVFRWIIPAILGLSIVPIFLLGKSIFKKNIFGFLASLTYITIPIILTEIEVSRPQLSLFYFSPLVLWLIFKGIENKETKLNYLFLALFITIIGIKTHNIFYLLLPVVACGFFICYSSLVKKHPFKAFLYALLFLIILFPYAQSYGVFDRIKYFISYFPLEQLHFSIKGAFGIKTYGANWGIFLPIGSLIGVFFLLAKWKKFNSKQKNIFLIIGLYCFIFLIFQEILPRIGWNFLPDRCFPHLAIGLIFFSLIPIYLFQRKVVYFTYVLLLALSLITTLYINTLSVGNIINSKEVDAAKFINNNTPSDSIIVTQTSNYPVIFAFSQRRVLYGESNKLAQQRFFQSNQTKESANFLYGLSDQMGSLVDRRESEANKLKLAVMNNQADSSLDTSDISSSLNVISILDDAINLQKNSFPKKSEVYVMYSFVKNQSYLACFDWWKEKSIFDANLEKFNDQNYFELVFNNNDVKIWKLKND